MQIAITAALLIASCSHTTEAQPQSVTKSSELKALYDAVLPGLATKSDQDSEFPSAGDCDATLWAGEAAAAGAVVKLETAEYNPGEIHRRPKANGECYPAGSASTVSKDMLLGYVYGKFAQKDLAALQRLADYGEAHNWVMGKPFPSEASRVVMAPDGAALLARAIEALSHGTDKRIYRDLPLLCTAVSSDFEYHLQTLGLMLDTEVADMLTGEALLDIPTPCFNVLKSNAAKFPNDALIQAAYAVYQGDFNHATDLLLDTNYQYPSYVRGADNYKLVHWLFAAKLILDHEKK
jgi:hypothetical protein